MDLDKLQYAAVLELVFSKPAVQALPAEVRVEVADRLATNLLLKLDTTNQKWVM